MPAPEGSWVANLNDGRRHALGSSEKHPDDWVRVETRAGEVVDTYFRGMKVLPYMGRPENLSGSASLSPRPEPNVRFSGGTIVRDSYIAECPGVYVVANPTPGKDGVIINFMEGKKVATTPRFRLWIKVGGLSVS